jgi:hypothetical protein
MLRLYWLAWSRLFRCGGLFRLLDYYTTLRYGGVNQRIWDTDRVCPYGEYVRVDYDSDFFFCFH